MGFKTLHEMETIFNVSKANYEKVGFGLVIDMRLVPLMLLGVWGSASLGLGSTNSLVISLGLWMVVVSALHCEWRRRPGYEGKLHWFLSCV